MANGPQREQYTMRARIQTTDNGATMVIRKHTSLDSAGSVVLNKVYTDFEALVKDLRENMKFKFSK